MFKVGDRVERNPSDVDWIKMNWDGGVGNLGTVVSVEAKFVDVNWDKSKKLRHYPRHLKVSNQSEKVMNKETDEILEHRSRRQNLAIYEEKVFTDFTIICKIGGEEYKFPCHKAIIAAVSGHFARMFKSGMTEVSNGEVEIQEYAKEEVEHFIKFLYNPKMDREVNIVLNLSYLAVVS